MLLLAGVDLLPPVEIDRALSVAVGPDWRRAGFEVDVTIGAQTYRVAHSIYAPNQLQINDRTMYSDLWG
jgi:hypothetical protein